MPSYLIYFLNYPHQWAYLTNTLTLAALVPVILFSGYAGQLIGYQRLMTEYHHGDCADLSTVVFASAGFFRSGIGHAIALGFTLGMRGRSPDGNARQTIPAFDTLSRHESGV